MIASKMIHSITLDVEYVQVGDWLCVKEFGPEFNIIICQVLSWGVLGTLNAHTVGHSQYGTGMT